MRFVAMNDVEILFGCEGSTGTEIHLYVEDGFASGLQDIHAQPVTLLLLPIGAR